MLKSEIKSECTCLLKAFQPVSEVFKAIRPLLIHVIAKTWEEADLLGLVEEAAIAAGLERVYTE